MIFKGNYMFYRFRYIAIPFCFLHSSVLSFFLVVLSPVPAWAAEPVMPARTIRTIETEARRLMREHDVPGLAIAVTVDGRHRIFNNGVVSRQSGAPVVSKTLFEIGSISKTFTGLLASYAQVKGKLSLFDEVSDHLPVLKGSAFDTVTVLNLATHTSGLELFLPDEARTQEALLAYCGAWTRRYSPGTQRTYSNIGTALLGIVGATAMKQSYDEVINGEILPRLGLSNTYTQVPAGRLKDYAQGYNRRGEPVRLASAPLAAATYGIRTTADDLIRYVEAYMGIGDLEPDMQRAIRQALTGYFKAGALTQDLIWEQYAYPVGLKRLLQGNSRTMVREDVPAMRLKPAFPPRKKVLINKSGSTRGFSAYVAFVPGSRIGVALLANKSVPAPDRVKTAYRILEALEDARP